MQVKLHNVGDAMRVLYDVTGRQVSIKINEERTVDIPAVLATRLQEAMKKGGTLRVVSAAEPEPAPQQEQKPGRVRIVKEGQAAAPKPKSAPAATPPQPKPKTKEAKVAKPTKEATAGKTDLSQLNPVEVLAIAESLDYHSLLASVNKAVPDNRLPPRPTKPQMIDVLREAASKVA